MNKEDNCIFCKIANKEIESFKIYEDEMVFVFLTDNPDYNGHMLIIPKKHIVDTSDLLLEDGLLNHIIVVAENMRKLIGDTIGINGMTYLWNMGNAQKVKHFHMHIKPRDKTLLEQPEKLPVDEIYTKYFKTFSEEESGNKTKMITKN